MASYVVQISYLEELFNQWVERVSQECGEPVRSCIRGELRIAWQCPYVPQGEDREFVYVRNKRKRRESPFFQLSNRLFESLHGGRWNRVQWFYYCDNDHGNTIRLYDQEHFAAYGSAYIELQNSGQHGVYTDRVLVRGENIETVKFMLKKFLRKKPLIQKRFSATGAPFAMNDQGCLTDFKAHLNVELFEALHAYFQDACHNNMPGNVPNNQALWDILLKGRATESKEGVVDLPDVLGNIPDFIVDVETTGNEQGKRVKDDLDGIPDFFD